jgi:hypothetical protein
MERGTEVKRLGTADVFGVHGLDQVSTGEVEQPRLVGLGQPPLEGDDVHALKRGIVVECAPDMGDEYLVVAEPPGRARPRGLHDPLGELLEGGRLGGHGGGRPPFRGRRDGPRPRPDRPAVNPATDDRRAQLGFGLAAGIDRAGQQPLQRDFLVARGLVAEFPIEP